MYKGLKICSILFVFTLLSCCAGDEKKPHTQTKKTSRPAQQRGAGDLDELSEALLSSLQSYLSLTLPLKIQRKEAKKFTSDSLRHIFLVDYDFNLTKEEQEFQQLIKHLKKFDLLTAHRPQVAVDLPGPLKLKKVVIPLIYKARELDIVYVAIEVDGRWMLTSKVGL